MTEEERRQLACDLPADTPFVQQVQALPRHALVHEREPAVLAAVRSVQAMHGQRR